MYQDIANKYKIETLKCSSDSGNTISYERYERVVPISVFEHDNKNKLLCKNCKDYEKNLSCPPYSPTFLDHIKKAKSSKVICLRFPAKHFNEQGGEDRYRVCFKRARALLVKELLNARGKGKIIAGAGACLECDPCAIADGSEICKNPKEKIYSLESIGVSVSALVKKCFDLNFEWPDDKHIARFICAVGAIF